MVDHHILRFAQPSRVVVWSLSARDLDAALERLERDALIERAPAELDLPQDSTPLTVITEGSSEAPQQWAVKPGIEAIFDIVGTAPVADVPLASRV